MHRLLAAGLLLSLAACGGGGGGGGSTPVAGGAPAPPPGPIMGISGLFEPPAFTGSHGVGTKAFHWVDPLREETITSAGGDQRELMVHMFYPADATTGDFRTPVVREREWTTLANDQAVAGRVLRRSNYDGVVWPIEHEPAVSDDRSRWPVLLFSHGGNGAIERHLFLIGELASRGVVVAAINHTYYTDFVEFPDGRVIAGRGFGLDANPAISPAEAQRLAQAQDLWSDDQVFVLEQLIALDQMPGSAFTGRLDTARIAAGGFSFGGASSYQAASKDARILAVINGDGTIWEPDGIDIGVPLLFVQSGSGVQFEIFDQVGAEGYAALFDGGVTHLAFEDRSLWWRWDFPAQNPFGSLGGEEGLRAMGIVGSDFVFKYLDGAAAPSLDDDLATPAGLRIRRF